MFELRAVNKDNFNNFYKLLEQDFCLEERRSKIDQIRALENSNFYSDFIYEKKQLVGYICYWKLNDFIFIEHFSILKDLRGKGIGGTFFKQFLDSFNKLIVFEVERGVNNIAQRRIAFYEKIGVTLNNYDYYQPSYHKSGDAIPMFLMSYNRGISKKEFNNIVDKLNKEVYET